MQVPDDILIEDRQDLPVHIAEEIGEGQQQQGQRAALGDERRLDFGKMRGGGHGRERPFLSLQNNGRAALVWRGEAGEGDQPVKVRT